MEALVAGKSFADYQADETLNEAVKYNLVIVGEALNKFAKVEPDLTPRIPELRSVVGFRNVVVHGYATLREELVWRIIAQDLPRLVDTVRALLDELS